jgi:hypothetical protein
MPRITVRKYTEAGGRTTASPFASPHITNFYQKGKNNQDTVPSPSSMVPQTGRQVSVQKHAEELFYL